MFFNVSSLLNPLQLIKYLLSIANSSSAKQEMINLPFFFFAFRKDVFKEIRPPKCWMSPSSADTYSGTSITPELGE